MLDRNNYQYLSEFRRNELQKEIRNEIKLLESLSYQNVISIEKKYLKELNGIDDKVSKEVGNVKNHHEKLKKLNDKVGIIKNKIQTELEKKKFSPKKIKPAKDFEIFPYLINFIVSITAAKFSPYNGYLTFFLVFAVINFVLIEIFKVEAKTKKERERFEKQENKRKEKLFDEVSVKTNQKIGKELKIKISETQKTISTLENKIKSLDKRKIILKDIKSKFEKIKQRAKERERSAKIAAYDSRARSGSQTVKKDLLKGIRNRHNWKCPYCDEKKSIKLSAADHIYPVNKGGLTTLTNMILICSSCNISKSNKTLRLFCREKKFNYDEVCERLERLGKEV